ncbi:hypothetical protein Pla110_23570 [Polystyrenella longa]|uniref:Uncharacterized protein n=1 Tax=Polystyrenella longa TaxID=2528007 RepID=A0A518CN18_9PLAN|nr:hypothetical protein [Polystyrenella longa]QDU80626.1 hypothetical protein Pla110_23570 [Polystyrenella longa]
MNKKSIVAIAMIGCLSVFFAWEVRAIAQQLKSVESTGPVPEEVPVKQPFQGADEPIFGTPFSNPPFSDNPPPIVDNFEGSSSKERSIPQNVISHSVKISQSVSNLHSAKTDEEKKQAETELSAALSAYFDNDLKAREREVQAVQERVKKLQDKLDTRREAKEEIVNLQLQLMVNEANGLGFYNGASNVPGQFNPQPVPYRSFNNDQVNEEWEPSSKKAPFQEHLDLDDPSETDPFG